MIIETTLFGHIDKVSEAINILREHEPDKGYYVADSGGKDSCVILALVKMAGVKHDAHHNFTTIDFPEVVYFIKREHPKTIIEYPKTPFLKNLVKNGYPRRQSRWCCRIYKERGGKNRFVITGVRGDESPKRKKRGKIEYGREKGKNFLHIIHGWSDIEVWEFIHKFNIPYPELYDRGFKRVGCMFCPFSGRKTRLLTAEKYPKHVKIWIHAFERLYQDRKDRGLHSVDRWASGEAMFWSWLKETKGQDLETIDMFKGDQL